MQRFGKILYCENPVEPFRERCKFHGGASPRGVEHPRFKGRGYSKDIPTQLAQKVIAALDDPALVTLGHEIALLDGRTGQIFEKMQRLESETAFDRIKDCIYAIEAALIGDRVDDAMVALKDAKKAISAASAERDGWSEIYSIIKERRQLVDAERKREETLQGNMNARQVGTFIAAVQTAIMEVVQDAEVRKQLAYRLQFLLHLQEGPMHNQKYPGYDHQEQRLSINRAQYLPPGSE